MQRCQIVIGFVLVASITIATVTVVIAMITIPITTFNYCLEAQGSNNQARTAGYKPLDSPVSRVGHVVTGS